jgi:flavorubredoxin
MKARKLTEHVDLIGAVDWNRRLFDSLIPLPEGTSYNAYLVRSAQKTVLIDTVDPTKLDILAEQLQDVASLDYLVANHAEQDHSGTIPFVLKKYPAARLVCSSKARDMLMSLLDLPAERIQVVADGETLSLGDLTLEFLYTPWVHWPETMCTYLHEDKILFSCDFFGSHLATTDIFVGNDEQVMRAAKRYYAEIMMPFRVPITKNLARIAGLQIEVIAPSHGPMYNHPEMIVDAYKDWVNGPPKNRVILPYVTMHHSTGMLVERLLSALAERGIAVQPFDLTVTDIGELAMAMVDAGTIVIGTPIMLGGPHPLVAYAAALATLLRPKAKFAAFMVSYGWGVNAVDRLPELIAGLKMEALPGVTCHGLPRQADLQAVDALAEAIARKHKEEGLQ